MKKLLALLLVLAFPLTTFASVTLNGSSNYIALASPINTYTPLTEGTICMWEYSNIPFNSGTADQLIGATTFSEIQWLKFTDGNLYFGSFNNGGRIILTASAANWPFHQWTQYCETYSISGSLMVLYINGVQVGSTNSFIDATGGPLWIGHGVEGYHNGMLSDFRIYNRALSAQEIRALYLGGRPDNKNLVVWLPLWDVAGVFMDLSGHRNFGTPVGFTPGGGVHSAPPQSSGLYW